MSTVWYCHECRTGPYNTKLVPKCVACGYHVRCGKCTVENRDDMEAFLDEDDDDTQSDYCDVACTKLSSGSTPTTLGPSPLSIHSADRQASLTPSTLSTSARILFHPQVNPSNAPVSTTVPNVDPFQGAPLTLGGAYNPPAPTDGGQSYAWECCYCQGALNSCRFDTHCTNCGVRRCDDCKLVRIKK